MALLLIPPNIPVRVLTPHTKEDNKVMSKQRINRKLSVMERLIWKNGYDSHNMEFILKINDSLSEDQLNASISKNRTKYPLLGVKITVDKNNVPWFTSDNVPTPTIQNLSVANDDDWMKGALKDMNTYLNWEKGPLFRFSLLHTPQNRYLLISCHHAICDALSVLYLLGDIVESIVNPDRESEIQEETPFVEDLLPPPTAGNLIAKYALKFLNILWPNITPAHTSIPEQMIKKEISCSLTWQLTTEQSTALVAKAKVKKVSVNSIICAAMVAAQHDVQGSNHRYLHKIQMPADIRNRLSDVGVKKDTFGLYVSQVVINARHSPNIDLWDIGSKLQEKIKRSMHNNKLYRPYYFLHFVAPRISSLIGKLSLKSNKIATGLTLSNISSFRFSDKHFMESLFILSHIRSTEKTLAVTNIGGKTGFCLTYRESVIATEIVEEVRDTAMEYLAKSIGW